MVPLLLRHAAPMRAQAELGRPILQSDVDERDKQGQRRRDAARLCALAGLQGVASIRVPRLIAKGIVIITATTIMLIIVAVIALARFAAVFCPPIGRERDDLAELADLGVCTEHLAQHIGQGGVCFSSWP